MQLLLSMVHRYGQSCMQKLWSAQAVLSLYDMLEFMLCSEIVLLLNMADMLTTTLWYPEDHPSA